MKIPVSFFAVLLAVAFTAVVQGEITSSADRAAVYIRGEKYFEDAILVKPRTAGAETNLEFALAPLLLQELGETNSIAWPTTVCFEPGQVTIHGSAHRQMTYWWEVNLLDGGDDVARDRRGVRVTLNSHGSPVIWEVLNDHSGGRVVFVAQSIETAASKLNGGVLAGRRFAVEQAVTAAPDVVVARVIENNATVMGPMVHLDAKGAVATLICRCMTAQTRAVSGSSEYELRPGKSAGLAKPVALEKVLRLPPDF